MYKDYRIFALICCRGGSKGIPGKNIKEFAGKPLLGWLLDAANGSGVFDDIVLSTDSEEIAQVGNTYGAMVPGLRPIYLAQDDSDQFDTHKYIFEKLNIKDDTHRVCILNNNPFIDSSLIKESYEKAIEYDFKYVVLDSVTVGGDYVYYRQCFAENDLLFLHFPKTMLESKINRQTISPLYTSINNIRWGKPSVLNSYENYKREIFYNGFVPVWLPKTRNFDLDDQEDWEIAEAVFNKIILPPTT